MIRLALTQACLPQLGDLPTLRQGSALCRPAKLAGVREWREARPGTVWLSRASVDGTLSSDGNAKLHGARRVALQQVRELSAEVERQRDAIVLRHIDHRGTVNAVLGQDFSMKDTEVAGIQELQPAPGRAPGSGLVFGVETE